MSKKYALILYGNLRSYKKASVHLKRNLLDINDVDIFISTHRMGTASSHSGLDSHTESFTNVYLDNLKDISFIEDINHDDLIETLKSKIKYVDYDLYLEYENDIENIKNIEDWTNFYVKLCNRNNKGFYLRNSDSFQYLLHELIMIYHRLNGFRLLEKYSKKNKINYDGVLIYRPDLYFEVPLDLSKFFITDQTIYFRLEICFLSSYNGIKKLVNNLFINYYDCEDTEYLDNLKKNKERFKFWFCLSEYQHNIFLRNKNNYLFAYDVLDRLQSFRAVENSQDVPFFSFSKEKVLIAKNKFYDNIKIIYNNLFTYYQG